MKNFLLLLLFLALFIPAACGVKGSLYLPEDKAANQEPGK